MAGARGGGAHARPGGAHGDHRGRGAQRARRGEGLGRRDRGRAPAGEGAGARARRGREGRPQAAPLGAGLRLRLLLARLTARHPPERTDQAEEGAAVGAGIALRGPLFVAAGAAHHRVVLLQFRLFHRSPQRSRAYTLILLISVAREMPSSWAARVRLPPWWRRARSIWARSTSARVSGWWRRSAAPALRKSAGRCSTPICGWPRARIIARSITFRISRTLPGHGADSRRSSASVAHSAGQPGSWADRKSTRLNSSHPSISYAVFCLKKKKQTRQCKQSYTSRRDSRHER